MDENKRKALDAALLMCRKQFGNEAVMMLGDNAKMDIKVISSGSIALDVALGVGGIPKGRIIEIYGPESGGKTTLALHTVASFQKAGENVAFIDAEHALDPKYAKKIGVNVDELVISQPSNGEQALGICDTLVRSGAFGLIVVDSVAALA